MARFKLVLLLFIIFAGAGQFCLGLQFNFSTFNPYTTGITLTDNAVFSSDAINLTVKGLNMCLGRLFYNEPVPLWTLSNGDVSLSSFSTSFLFQILNTSDSIYFGDGVAFFMTAELSPIPAYSTGGYLGLVNELHDGFASNNIVAVEFDSFNNYNEGDKDSNHVGIDVNSIISSAYRSLFDVNINIKYSTKIMAWVDYNGDSRLLSVDVAVEPFTRPVGLPFLTLAIDLSHYLPNSIYIGLSSATGRDSAVHQILSWKFSSSTLLPSSAPPVVPPISPDADVAPPSIAPNVAPPVVVSSRESPLPIPVRTPPDVISKPKMLSGAIIAAIALAGIFSFLLFVVIPFLVWRKRKNGTKITRSRRLTELKLKDADLAQCAGPVQRFTLKEIERGTQNFSEENYLGCGGFGHVHKGTMSNVSTCVAVKSISHNSRQGGKEFLAEVTIISRIHHKNLVRLLGWCHEKGKLFLVYDYMPNGSLDKYLFKKDCTVTVTSTHHNDDIKTEDQQYPFTLDWNQRYKIICGLAAGLLYLHEEGEKQVIHRDVKSANVMLDKDFNARLGDFGMARLVDHNMMLHTTMAAGTFGYLAPEIIETGKVTSASDVYSFGAVALEVACGRSCLDYNAPTGQVRLTEFVWDLFSKGVLLEAVDPRLGVEYEKGQMERVLCLGLACSHPLPLSRPTMRQVLDCLLNATSIPPIPTSKPTIVSSQAFFQHQPRSL